ncbi:peroxiredoxin family protein [Amycolatopsis sp. OK19-0408]|uniref:Peroxiredoxin family protein n=1 Tax=Amycolatopsis iheyensis TaxID=2945988 RepID=A0A9X2NGS7_9PSEU|nr:peroxiredoxin family protein [Amycolatopsis iheyensis]MCR6487528.1 peroxiredoxin family protein [Amycolatopsis iheyensis]
MLEPGSPAPELVLEDLLLEDTDGRPVHLAGRAALVYFMRSATCPVCTRHVRDLAADADTFAAAGVRVFIAVPEDRETAAAWRAKRRIPFPVLVGRRGTPHELVGLSRAVFGALQRSGSVLLDVDGIVRHAHSAVMPTGSYDKKGVAAAVAALRAPT